jgi:hypothetical protein
MRPTFEYCAAQYLDMWVKKEAKLHNNLKTTAGGEAVRSALAYFRVSRGFPGIDKAEIQESVGDMLRKNVGNLTHATVPEHVIALGSAFEQAFKQNNLSAASKLLWLLHRSPVVLMDSRATRALRKLKFRFDQRDYDAYFTAWHQAFNSHRVAVLAAASRVPKFLEFTAASGLRAEHVARLCAKRWFAERVFDQYLWQIGAPTEGSGTDEEE